MDIPKLVNDELNNSSGSSNMKLYNLLKKY